MRLPTLAAVVATATFAPAQAQVREIPGTEFEAGNWIGGAYTDAAGRFSYCYATVSYVNGQTLWLGLYPNDTLSILLSQPDVRFKPGQTFELWVMMETGLPMIGKGEAWDENYGGITYTGISATVDFLNSGRYLRMLGMGIDDGFDLDGIGPALVRAQECLAGQGGAGGKVLEAAPSVKAAPGGPDATGPRTSGIGSDGGPGTRPGGAIGTPVPKPQP
ncbi:MAG: hypothetical protein ACK4TJ_11865 [Tabrizicola sp.]